MQPGPLAGEGAGPVEELDPPVLAVADEHAVAAVDADIVRQRELTGAGPLLTPDSISRPRRLKWWMRN